MTKVFARTAAAYDPGMPHKFWHASKKMVINYLQSRRTENITANLLQLHVKTAWNPLPPKGHFYLWTTVRVARLDSAKLVG